MLVNLQKRSVPELKIIIICSSERLAKKFDSFTKNRTHNWKTLKLLPKYQLWGKIPVWKNLWIQPHEIYHTCMGVMRANWPQSSSAIVYTPWRIWESYDYNTITYFDVRRFFGNSLDLLWYDLSQHIREERILLHYNCSTYITRAFTEFHLRTSLKTYCNES